MRGCIVGCMGWRSSPNFENRLRRALDYWSCLVRSCRWMLFALAICMSPLHQRLAKPATVSIYVYRSTCGSTQPFHFTSHP